MRISDWSSDVCSSDLDARIENRPGRTDEGAAVLRLEVAPDPGRQEMQIPGGASSAGGAQGNQVRLTSSIIVIRGLRNATALRVKPPPPSPPPSRPPHPAKRPAVSIPHHRQFPQPNKHL